MTNRLAGSTSPYLLQHAENPVDWYPWGEEALERARREDRPILLSIGYSACHWCHVMAHESFEDPGIAARMNRHFVNVKVDREERPDLDEIYMTATQIQTGHGGWPMTVFLTPRLEPFLCGTYFPPEPRHGMPSFPQLLEHVAHLWENQREDVAEQSRALLEGVRRYSTVPAGGRTGLDDSVLDQAYEAYARGADRHHGGFGGAPKFPQPMAWLFLLRYWKRTGNADALDLVTLTCEEMARGGIYDHLGGGFARYSVDARWVVPHFEKMLYDNALLARLYLEAFQATGREEFRRVARETLDYVRRDLGSEGGGFASSEDADSEGEEGKFYVWRPSEIEEVLGDPEAAKRVCRWYGVSEEGNFEHGTTVLTRTLEVAQLAKLFGRDEAEVAGLLDDARAKLFRARETRVRPGRDDKVLAGWTGLMAHAYALAYRVLGRDEDRASAEGALRFLLGPMRPDGRLRRAWRAGEARIEAFQEDHAFVLEALVAMYEATFEPEWIERAIEVADAMIERFWDDREGGFFFTDEGRPDVLVRSKSPYENAIPSGNAAAAMGLGVLARLTGRDAYRRKAEATLEALRGGMERATTGFPYLIAALDLHLTPPRDVVLVGPDDASLAPFRQVLARRFEPTRLLAGRIGDDGRPDLVPALEGKNLVGGQAAAYVCQDFTCFPPATTPEALEALLGK